MLGIIGKRAYFLLRNTHLTKCKALKRKGGQFSGTKISLLINVTEGKGTHFLFTYSLNWQTLKISQIKIINHHAPSPSSLTNSGSN